MSQIDTLTSATTTPEVESGTASRKPERKNSKIVHFVKAAIPVLVAGVFACATPQKPASGDVSDINSDKTVEKSKIESVAAKNKTPKTENTKPADERKSGYPKSPMQRLDGATLSMTEELIYKSVLEVNAKVVKLEKQKAEQDERIDSLAQKQGETAEKVVTLESQVQEFSEKLPAITAALAKFAELEKVNKQLSGRIKYVIDVLIQSGLMTTGKDIPHANRNALRIVNEMTNRIFALFGTDLQNVKFDPTNEESLQELVTLADQLRTSLQNVESIPKLELKE